MARRAWRPDEKWVEDEAGEAAVQAAMAGLVQFAREAVMPNDKFRKDLINHALWSATVHPYGKYKIRYRSERAARQTTVKGLVHEHVFTRKLLVAHLMSTELDGDEVLALIRSRAVGCIVTKEEHQMLSAVDTELEGWDRYIAADIDVRDMENSERVDLPRSRPSTNGR